MCSKVYLLVFLISTLTSLSIGEGLFPQSSRHVRAAPKLPVGQISAKKCEEYSKLVKNNECTHFNPDKPWDYEAKSGEFPHMALLNIEGDDKLICAGSLISDKFVLTAPYCPIHLEKKNGNGTFWVRLGENSLEPTTKSALRLKVVKYHNHPEYSDTNNKRENYMSLLELEKSVQFDETKRPACLNTVKEIVEPVFVSGWGISAESRGSKSKTLLKTVLEISKQNEKPLNVDPDSPMFILTKPKPGKKDACMGDSGAPVMTNLKNHPCMYNIVGVVAYGGRCSQDQTASARVSNYIQWIESIVWPEGH